MSSIATSKGKRKVAEYRDNEALAREHRAREEKTNDAWFQKCVSWIAKERQKPHTDYDEWAKKKVGETDKDVSKRKAELDKEHLDYGKWLKRQINKQIQDNDVPPATVALIRASLDIDDEFVRIRDKFRWSPVGESGRIRQYWDLMRQRQHIDHYHRTGKAPCKVLAGKAAYRKVPPAGKKR